MTLKEQVGKADDETQVKGKEEKKRGAVELQQNTNRSHVSLEFFKNFAMLYFTVGPLLKAFGIFTKIASILMFKTHDLNNTVNICFKALSATDMIYQLF
ncbi:hypothetical protein RRG08_034713 [Elysia crispata]|uniref:Uncharacterized protein n=1 Tax=Elysia crispata TaxID=231223 RepID=A0AAE0Z2W1_9GAST|nr:hypothetical protein RRG08_034713 [Elysia crispata]